jgi:hypothetical protein
MRCRMCDPMCDLVRVGYTGVNSMKTGRQLRGLGAVAVFAALAAFGLEAAAQVTKKASPCKGLDEKACKAKTAECAWIAPKKGRQKPYCRLGPASKK